MPQPPEHVAGNIYDLGYRRYEGVRLGRAYAVRSLYLQSLKSAFGLGRRGSSKVIPFGLAIVMLLPAAIQLGVAVIAPSDVTVVKPENYFSFVQLIVALFCAAVAPEMVGRDQRTKTLSLYFSRSLLRRDYALAKVLALASAILIVTLGPQIVLFAGRTLASQDGWAYLRDNWRDVLPIAGSAIAVAVFMASISLAIAAQTPRRAFATGGVLAFFVVMSSVGGIIFVTTGGDAHRYAVLLDLFTVLQGLTFWIFRAQAPSDMIVEAGLSGWIYLATVVTYTSLGLAVVFRRYQKVPA